MRGISSGDVSEIRSYQDDEIPAALARLVASPVTDRIRQSYFPALSSERFAALLGSIRSRQEFQRLVIAPAIEAMLARSSGGFSISGGDALQADRQFVFVSNHRDIVSDPALLSYGLIRYGREAPLICLGDNLLSTPFVRDLVKLNGAITVKRGLGQRELLRWSHALSELVSHAVRSREASVWIAQREGRAKDGDDRTNPGIVKMLALSGTEPLLDRLATLHLVPVAISYEWNPCDALKARELYYARRPEGYRKSPGEDERSMALGIGGQKGRIHVAIGSELVESLAEARAVECRKEQVRLLAAEIDRQIHLGYRLWPSNHVAFDLERGVERGTDQYTDADRARFLARMEEQIAALGEAPERLPGIREQFIGMYARPVANQLRWRGQGLASSLSSGAIVDPGLQEHGSVDPQ